MYVSWPIRCCAAALLAMYCFVIARLTLAPAGTETRTFDLLDRVMTRVSHGRLHWSQTEVLANVALFVPAGFLLCIVVGRVWAAVILCALASAAIELAQQRWLPSRVPSVADVEHNTFGALIGAVLAWPINLLLRLGARRGPITDPFPAHPVSATDTTAVLARTPVDTVRRPRP